MTENKRFIPIFDGTDKRVVGAKDNGKIISFMTMFDLLNDLSDENEKLKKGCYGNLDGPNYYQEQNGHISERLSDLEEENEQLKQFISKIDFAIIRKYDNSLENLLDEIYDGEYENWIKKQVSRAKKLDGDV